MTVQKSSDRLNWDDLRYFSALADTGRVSAAAARLGVNHVTVSRRIDRLEESLNKKLFARSNDGYSLTLEGNELREKLDDVTPALEHIANSTSTDQRAVKKTIKLSMVHSMADALVLPPLCELQKHHPNLNLEINTSTRNVSIAKRESDIALRLALPESGDYITRRLANLDYILCGTEVLASQCCNGKPVPIISYNHSLSSLPESNYLLTHYGIENIALQTNSATVQCSAAVCGIGIALLPQFLFKNSGLTKIEMHEPVQREIWLLAKKSTSELAEVRLVMDTLISLCKKRKDLLEAR